MTETKKVSNIIGDKVLMVLSLVLDASAKPSSGFTIGNNFWFGSRKTCAYANQRIPVELSDQYKSKTKPGLYFDTSPFEVQWSVVYVKQESPLQGTKNFFCVKFIHQIFTVHYGVMQENLLHIGLCLPKSCEQNQIRFLVQTFFDSSEAELFRVQARVVDVKDPKFNLRLLQNSAFWILSLFIVIIKFLNHKATKLEKDLKLDENNNIAVETENAMKLPLRKKIIKCFNFELNKKDFISKEISSSTVSSIAGLK